MSDGDAMGPNLLPDWTEEETSTPDQKLAEEVKKEGDRIFSGMMNNCVPNSSTLSITLKDLIDMKEKIDKQFPSLRAYISRLLSLQIMDGLLFLTVIYAKRRLSSYRLTLVKPSDGDYFRLNGTCLDEEKHIKHNMYPQTWYPWREEKIKIPTS